MFEILEQTAEYQGFGVNLLTLGAIGAFILLIFEVWATLAQAQRIWTERSAGALSTYYFGYITAFMFACVPYGISLNSIVVAGAGFISAVTHAPILWGIYKFRGFTRKEAESLRVFSLMLPVMILWLAWQEVLYLLFAIGTVWAVAVKPLKMWNEESAAVVELKFLVIFFISTLFWCMYSIALFRQTSEGVALAIITPIQLVLFAIALGLWWRFQEQS